MNVITVAKWSWETWRRHQRETFSALLTICEGNSPVPAQRPVTRSFDVFFDLRLNKRLSKQSWACSYADIIPADTKAIYIAVSSMAILWNA